MCAAALALLAARRRVLAHATIDPADLWISAGRFVLRLLVLRLAEARDLLPRDLHQLHDELTPDAWPRLLALLARIPDDEPSLLTSPADPPDESTLRALLDLTRVDPTTWTDELLGALHEQILDHTLHADLTLVRRTSARKRTGSFYTRAALGEPTVRRTLAPLTHDANGKILDPATLLALRLCDPAMGAGNFLLAALRVLTDLVREASQLHGPTDALQIRRLVATRCLHGVDRDPLAVLLARLALWLAVGDPSLAPDAMASHLRCGDALIGAWRRHVADYPLHAWSRESASDLLRQRRKQLLAEPAAPVAADPPREQYDLWCALWFWPLDSLADAPTPATFTNPTPIARTISTHLQKDRRFFHWELEFPEIFNNSNAGFDAILGNPPWEIRKPSSQEFFAVVDPGYRARSKQDALTHQRELFNIDTTLERRWHDYLDDFKHVGNFTRHNFKSQGSADLSNYKLFVEQAYTLLRPGGQLGLVVPSALYTDKGSAALRRLLLGACRWRWLYGFENRARVFEIHRSFKFAVIVAEKGGATDVVQAAFMRHDLADWATGRGALAYPAAQVHALSPRSLALLEIRSERDLAVLAALHARGVPLGDPGPRGWDLRYATELHTTNDSHRFTPRDRAAANGYQPDEYGRWIGPDGDTLVPLHEGRMIGPFDPSRKGWVRGKGRTALWRDLPHGAPPEPQFLLRPADVPDRGPKVAYMRVAASTNSRTVISTYLRDNPAGDSVFFFLPADRSPATALAVVGIFNSFAYDFAVRARIGGLNLSEFLMLETPLVDRTIFNNIDLTQHLLRLACASPWFAPEWLALGRRDQPCGISDPGERERLRLRCIVDAVVAAAYGLTEADLRWILRDCDLPRADLADPKKCRGLDPKGFWRVDRERDPELRHSVLTLVAFAELVQLQDTRDLHAAIATFLAGDGWQLPATLRLADLDLGHDDRARIHQPVASRLADAPLVDLTASWAACERHAARLRGA